MAARTTRRGEYIFCPRACWTDVQRLG